MLESENLTNYASFFADYLSDNGKAFVEREEKTKHLYKIARAKNLIMTAGSDFHSPDKEEAPELACWKDYGLELNLDKRLIQALN